MKSHSWCCNEENSNSSWMICSDCRKMLDKNLDWIFCPYCGDKKDIESTTKEINKILKRDIDK